MAAMNSTPTAAGFLLLLGLVVVVAAGAREGPASAPAPQVADDVGSLHFRGAESTAAGPTQGPSTSAPVPLAADAAGKVSFDIQLSTASRRCDSDARWNDQLCRTVCGMFKYRGYEFTAPAADAVPGQDEAAPRCCCCPDGGATGCDQFQ